MSRKEFKPGGQKEKMIAMSKWVAFRRKDRKLIIKLFRCTLDDYLKRTKKSHWIKLECLWENLGCKTTYDRKKDDIYPKKRGEK